MLATTGYFPLSKLTNPLSSYVFSQFYLWEVGTSIYASYTAPTCWDISLPLTAVALELAGGGGVLRLTVISEALLAVGM